MHACSVQVEGQIMSRSHDHQFCLIPNPPLKGRGLRSANPSNFVLHSASYHYSITTVEIAELGSYEKRLNTFK